MARYPVRSEQKMPLLLYSQQEYSNSTHKILQKKEQKIEENEIVVKVPVIAESGR